MSVRCTTHQLVKRKLTRREKALAKKLGVRPKRYIKRRKRKFRVRLDPRKLWPNEKDFMARFRLPVELVEHLSKMFARSKACTTKGTKRGGGIPIFHKVNFEHLRVCRCKISFLTCMFGPEGAF